MAIRRRAERALCVNAAPGRVVVAEGYADLRRAMPLMETVAVVTPPPKSIW